MTSGKGKITSHRDEPPVCLMQSGQPWNHICTTNKNRLSQLYIWICICMQAHTFILLLVHAYMQLPVIYMCVYMYIYMHTYIFVHTDMHNVCVCVCVHIREKTNQRSRGYHPESGGAWNILVGWRKVNGRLGGGNKRGRRGKVVEFYFK